MFERDYSHMLNNEELRRMSENGELLRWCIGRSAYLASGVLNGSSELDLDIPQTGYFEQISFYFSIPNTGNRCFFQFEPCEDEEDKRSFRIGVYRDGYDLVVSSFIFTKAANGEIREYLMNESHMDELEETIIRLSNSVDDKMD